MVFTSTQETFGDGTRATFECATGYVSAGGSRSVTCTAGVWSEVKLTCKSNSNNCIYYCGKKFIYSLTIQKTLKY